MRFRFTILLMMIICGSFGQKPNLSGIQFAERLDTTASIYATLCIKDTSALILHYNIYTSRAYNYTANYIIFYENGKIELTTTSFDHIENKATRLKVKGKSRKPFFELLNDIIDSNRYTFNQHQLNIQEKKMIDPKENDFQSIPIDISHGATYRIEFIKGNGISSYSTFEPKTYIDADFPGKEERIRFEVLFKELEAVFNEAIAK